MSLTLTPETERLLRDVMARGGYRSEDDAIRRALLFLERQESSGEGGSLFGAMSDYADDLDAATEQAMKDRRHPPSRIADAG